MIEISDSTATRRSERKRGKGRRAIDATTMMGWFLRDLRFGLGQWRLLAGNNFSLVEL